MKIVVFSQLPPPVHGSTIVTEQLLRILREEGHQLYLLDRRFSRSVAEVGAFSLRKVAAAVSLWCRAVRLTFHRPDLVVFFGTNRPTSFLVDVGVSSLFALSRTPVVQYLHTVGFRSLGARDPVMKRLVLLLLKQCQEIVCLAPSVAEDVAPFAAGHQITLISNAVDPLTERPLADPPLFVYLANLIPEKGALDVVEVARRLNEAAIPAAFEIYGYPADRSFFDRLMAEIGTLTNVHYGGPVSDADQKSDVLGRATALLYPTTYAFEAQPLAIIEAMSVSTPTIAYDAGAIAELVVHDKSGIVCESIDDLYDSVVRLATQDSTTRRLMRAAAGAQYQRDHTVTAFRENWVRVIEKYAPSPRRSSPGSRGGGKKRERARLG